MNTYMQNYFNYSSLDTIFHVLPASGAAYAALRSDVSERDGTPIQHVRWKRQIYSMCAAETAHKSMYVCAEKNKSAHGDLLLSCRDHAKRRLHSSRLP